MRSELQAGLRDGEAPRRCAIQRFTGIRHRFAYYPQPRTLSPEAVNHRLHHLESATNSASGSRSWWPSAESKKDQSQYAFLRRMRGALHLNASRTPSVSVLKSASIRRAAASRRSYCAIPLVWLFLPSWAEHSSQFLAVDRVNQCFTGREVCRWPAHRVIADRTPVFLGNARSVTSRAKRVLIGHARKKLRTPNNVAWGKPCHPPERATDVRALAYSRPVKLC
jgi:hypothetical protein